jgi:hypothetical protein
MGSVKIKILRECNAPCFRQIHFGEGCNCGVMEPRTLEVGEEFEEYQLSPSYGLDISSLKYREDYDIIEYP